VKVGVALGVGTIEGLGDGLGVASGRDEGRLKFSSPGMVCGAAVFG
jgi:hypothetical protein